MTAKTFEEWWEQQVFETDEPLARFAYLAGMERAAEIADTEAERHRLNLRGASHIATVDVLLQIRAEAEKMRGGG